MSDSDFPDSDEAATIPGRKPHGANQDDTARGEDLARAEERRERERLAAGAGAGKHDEKHSEKHAEKHDDHDDLGDPIDDADPFGDDSVTVPRLLPLSTGSTGPRQHVVAAMEAPLSNQPTQRGERKADGRTWTFVAGATLSVDRAATLGAGTAGPASSLGGRPAGSGAMGAANPGSEDPSALNALLQDIERSFAGAAESARPGPLIGHANRFQLTTPLGRGGMGVVFKAFDHELRRFIAIKLLARSQSQLAEDKISRFLRNEARAIAALSHPNIVQVFDISSWCDVPFLVMEYIEGRPLDELMRAPLPVPRVLHIADQLLAGLEHAHGAGVIHRDLKPSNIFETTRGEIKILDFGIASLASGGGRAGLDPSLLAESISGTPGYMSPEQWRDPEQDARTDVWAVGVLLIGMLSGVPLFADRPAAEVREEVLSVRPTLRERDYRIPRPLFRVIEKALEKSPDKRYQTVAQLRQALADAALALGHGARAREPMLAEQRQVTVVACSIGIDGVTDFETAADILRTWHNTVAAIVHRGGGFVMTSVGASMLACFGYPAIHEDDAVRAVGVACAIREIASEFLRPSERQAKVRLGVNTGFGVVEELPGVVSGVPVLHGPATQLAVQVRDSAEPGTVLVSEQTGELVRGYFTLGERAASAAPPRRVGERALATYAVERARAMTTRFDAAAMRDAAPLVGRQVELEVQNDLWKQATRGHGAVYCVLGEAGVGKSRLIHRLRQLAQADGGQAYTCQCWQQATQSPFHPLLSFLLQALEIEGPAITPHASAATVEPAGAAQRGRLARGLARLGMDSARDVAVFTSLLSLPAPEGAAAPAESAEALRRATIARLTELVRRMASRAPLLLVLEDLHWADHSTLDFLDQLLPLVAAQRLLVALTARKDVEPFWRQRAECHERELAGLSPQLTAELVRHLHHSLAPGTTLEPTLVDEIAERSNGLPLYVEELTRALAQQAGGEPLVPDGRAVADQREPSARGGDPDGFAGGAGERSPRGSDQRPHHDRAGAALPATLLGLLGTRLDQLSAHARTVAQLGAVLGRDFRYELLEELLAEPTLPGAARVGADAAARLASLDAALEELSRKGIAVAATSESGASYVFRHALLRDVAYQTMPPELRRARHARVADLLERRSAQVAGANEVSAAVPPELIAYHYDEADRSALALQYWERAGIAAAKKWAVKEAVGHFGRALQLLASLPDAAGRGVDELRLLLALGPPLMSVQGYAAPRVEDTYARAYELCLSQGRHAQTFPPLVGLWQYNMVGGNLPKAATLGTRLLTLAEGVNDSTMKLIAMRAIGTTRFLQGDIEAAIAHTRAGWLLYDRAQHGELAFKHGNDPGVGHGIYLAWALWQGGYPDQGLEQARATLALARSLEHPMSIAFCLCYTAIVCNLRGEHADASERLLEAIAVADANQLGLWKALALIQLGWARACLGEAEAVDIMTKGIAAWRETGARAGTTFFYVAQAQAQLAHEDRVGAAASLEAASALAQQNGEHFYEPELLRTKAMLGAAEGAAGSAGSAGSATPAELGAADASELLRRARDLAIAQRSRSWQLRLECDLYELAKRRGPATAEREALAECFRWFGEGYATRDLRRAAALLYTNAVSV
jgi:class 3 adenylate cyclase/tRNA A-37 threonylcarbamoyl transferase component Bud32